MNIAVLLSGVGLENQNKVVNGILDSALQDEANVYIFTCDRWKYESKSIYEKGEYNIYSLPDFTQYDGIIIISDNIYNQTVTGDVITKIRESKVPCVSLGMKLDDIIYVHTESQSGVSAIVKHLTEKHGAKKIYYVSGPLKSKGAGERLAAYKAAMEKCCLEWNEQMIAYGDYTYKSGFSAVKKFIQEDMPMPDAIMAANDTMAIGVIMALQEAGYRVPEDILVTGYDNTAIAGLNAPRLTTVKRGGYTAAETAYKLLMQAIRKENPPMESTVYGKPIFSQSCGCDKKHSYTHAQLQEMYVKNTIEVRDNLELLKNCAAEFTGLNTFNDFMECVKPYIVQLAPEYFYLCMCGSIENYYDELERMAEGNERGRDETAYKDDIWVPIAYEKGTFTSYEGFHRKYLLPPSCKKEEKGAFYLVMPLHHQEYCFGYCVIGNYKPALENRFLRHFIMSIDNALETVRRQDTMNAMLGRLSKVWLYDELTGVNNRAGFRKFAPRILEEARRKELPIAAVFADMDGLKKVNDLYGHEEGDAYIKAMANILESNRRHGELLTRYGGDEFVIIMNGCFEEDVREFIYKIQEDINNYNVRYTKAYKLDASIGYRVEVNAENINLENLVEMADQNMYEIKREKKRNR